MKRILIGCEESGIVREAFRAKGWDAWSCDLFFDSAIPGQHIKGDVLDIINDGWDAAIFFPPCTDIAISGARWFPEKVADGRQQFAINFFLALTKAPIERWAIENPIGIMSTHYRKPDQIIQPWQFGHGETKATCLWLKNFPCLVPTNIVSGRENRIWKMGPSKDRAKLRSKTFQGIADAMAEQWAL